MMQDICVVNGMNCKNETYTDFFCNNQKIATIKDSEMLSDVSQANIHLWVNACEPSALEASSSYDVTKCERCTEIDQKTGLEHDVSC